MKKIPAIITAVSASSVFPNRSLLELNGITILECIKRRLEKAQHISEVVLCTSIEPEDEILCAIGKKIGMQCFRGDSQAGAQGWFDRRSVSGAW